jgi:predicted RNA methylase
MSGAIDPWSFEGMKAAKAAGVIGGGVRVVSAPEFYPTPQVVVDRLMSEAGAEPGLSWLEPSAGDGALVRGILATDPGHITAIEIDPDLAGALGSVLSEDDGLVMRGDFMTERAEDWTPLVDRVLLNPPFRGGADVDHVLHAFDFLEPGGRLVAVMAESFNFHSGKKYAAFRDWIDTHGWHEALPEGSFKPMSGVNTRLVVADK